MLRPPYKQNTNNSSSEQQQQPLTDNADATSKPLIVSDHPKPRRGKGVVVSRRNSSAAFFKSAGHSCLGLVLLGWLGVLFGYALYVSLNTLATTNTADLPPTIKKNRPVSNNNNDSVDPTLAAARLEFQQRYGGAVTATALLRRGVQSLGRLEHTATRLLRLAAATSTAEPVLALSFAGYSVTVGRGNHYNQSYPFVLERILQPILRDHALFQKNNNGGGGVQLQVINAAIGGIPSFPYGFCFPHFLGRNADVISWDYSMNEGNGAAVLEAYLRQSQNQLSHHPMMIVLDTNPKRCQLLQDYADRGWLSDGICVGMAKDAVPNLAQILAEPHPPLGFQNWDEFGAGPSCPGRGSWHPKKKEHELIGWMMAMYFIDALALAEQMARQDPHWRTTYGTTTAADDDNNSVQFAAPLQAIPDNPPAVNRLLYGATDQHQDTMYRMKTVSCRTNFQPATDDDKVLPSIVVSGLAPEHNADIMQPRTDETYHSGWVLDVSPVERDTKVKVQQCGGLGYIDWKIALYGIPASGWLRLWLPVENDVNDNEKTAMASDWFDGLIICEANEKRDKGACRLDSDLEYLVDGKAVPMTQMVSGVGEYLKRKTCVNIGLPSDAKVVRLQDVRMPGNDNTPLSDQDKNRLSRNGLLKDDHVGLMVDLRAKPNVNRKLGACCVSHVVWSQH